MRHLTLRHITALFLLIESALVLVALGVTKFWHEPTPWARWVSFGLLVIYAALAVLKLKKRGKPEA
jgi:hypothetical protein